MCAGLLCVWAALLIKDELGGVRGEEEARKAGGGDPVVTKSEMKSEMRSMIQELL